jgi:hypothetical protein
VDAFGDLIILLGLMSIYAAVGTVLSWRICTKAGFPGPLGLLALLPFGLVVLLCIWAFAEWPCTRLRYTELDE